MRVVLDTNVLISAAYGASETMRTIATWIMDGVVFPAISPEGLAEFNRVAGRPWFAERIPPDRLATLVRELAKSAAECPPLAIDRVVEEDPDDDIILATAIACEAVAIVSGDDHLLRLQEHRGIPIFSPAEFVAEFSEALRVGAES